MNSKAKGYSLAIGAATLWGVSGNFAQFLFQHRGVDAEWLVTVRLLVAGVMLLLFARAVRKQPLFDIWRDHRSALILILFGVFGMLGVQYTYFAAIRTSNAATATVLQYLGPVFIAIYYALVDRRIPRVVEVVAVSLAVAGTYLLVTHGSLSALAISPEALGWGLASAVTLAYYSIQPIPLLRKFDSSVVVGWGMLVGGVAISLIRPPWHLSGSWDIAAVFSAGFIILFGSLIAFYAYLSSIKIVGANTASLLACAEPLSATLVAVAWLGVSFGVADWIGTLVIIATIALLTLSER
jgi:drug/metabolite transporter (DMT)-like permease